MKIDLVGEKFGLLTVNKKLSKNNRIAYECSCDCGNKKIILKQSLMSGATQSCGCQQYKNRPCSNKINILGQKFGKLTVTGKGNINKQGEQMWFCSCECGKQNKLIRSSSIRSGKTKSCGCIKHILCSPKYGWNGYEEINGTFWYHIVNGAKIRNLEFSITIEQVWELFLNQNRKCSISGVPITFARSYKNKKEQTASLDRIDSSIGYTINNIQWVHQDINYMKNILSNKKLLEWCEIVYRYNFPDDQ